MAARSGHQTIMKGSDTKKRVHTVNEVAREDPNLILLAAQMQKISDLSCLTSVTDKRLLTQKRGCYVGTEYGARDKDVLRSGHQKRSYFLDGGGLKGVHSGDTV